jgi:hypothetical protein
VPGARVDTTLFHKVFTRGISRSHTCESDWTSRFVSAVKTRKIACKKRPIGVTVGTEVIRFQYNQPETCSWVAPNIERANGERVRFPITRFRGGHRIFNETLEPDAAVSIHVRGILALGASATGQKHGPRIEKPESGEYRLHGRYIVHRLDENGEQIIQRNAEGTKTVKYSVLTSGKVTFHID